MKCTICGKPIVLIPTAKERADKDVTGKTAAYYTKLFTEHTECILRKREEDTLALIRKKAVGHKTRWRGIIITKD